MSTDTTTPDAKRFTSHHDRAVAEVLTRRLTTSVTEVRQLTRGDDLLIAALERARRVLNDSCAGQRTLDTLPDGDSLEGYVDPDEIPEQPRIGPAADGVLTRAGDALSDIIDAVRAHRAALAEAQIQIAAAYDSLTRTDHQAEMGNV